MVGKARRGINHCRKIVLYLLAAAAGKQCYDGARRQIVTMTELVSTLSVRLAELAHLLCRWISYVMYRVMVLLLEEGHLERQYREQLVDIALDALDAPLLPRPYLGRDVIVDGYLRMRMDIFGYVEIESWIVDEYKCIGLPLHNVALALCHIAEDGRQMHEYGYKAHICQLTIVSHTYPSDIRHLVAAEETELGCIVYTTQSSHKVRSVQVARGFANNQVVSHISIQN